MRFYKCTGCDNIVMTVQEGTCTPHCCGKEMIELKANTVDAAKEKHVPAVAIDGNKVNVVVGEVEHPMLPEHSIRFIVLETETGCQIKHLQPGERPAASFVTDEKPLAVYEYCNLHGLWKKEL